MIPVPMLFVGGYSIENEKDEKYQDVLSAEWKWITKNQEYITKKARFIYEFKNNEPIRRNEINGKRYDAVLPFKEIEKYVKLKYN